MKIGIAHVLSSIILLAGISVLAVRNVRRAPTLAGPEEAVYAMFEAARAGSVDGYLNAFGGSLQDSLRSTIAEKTAPAFAVYLSESAAPVKGIALSDPQWESETKARIRLEYIYQDRNEVQSIEIQKISKSWKITKFEAGESVKAPIPYATPMTNRWR